MPDTAAQLRAKLANARSQPVHAFGDITLQEARRDRAEAIAELETLLAQREAEESGSWLGQHPEPPAAAIAADLDRPRR